MLRQPRHGQHVAAQRVHKASTSAQIQLSDRQHEILWRAFERWIVTDRERRFGQTDIQLLLTELFDMG